MGGAFNLCSADYQRARIKVGLDYDKFEKVAGCAVHEALEFSLTRMSARFIPSLDLSCDHSAYLFSFNHLILSEVSMMVAEFITATLPVLREAWEKRAEPEE